MTGLLLDFRLALRALARRPLLTVLRSFLAITAVPGTAAQQLRTYPVYDLDTPGHTLQARVVEVPFPVSESFAWSELENVAASSEHPPSVRVASRYLVRVVEGRFDELPELFWMETTSPRAIRTLAKLLQAVLGMLGEPQRLTFLHTWHYGDFRMVVMRVDGSAGGRTISLGMVERDGSLLRSDDWGEALPVMDLFSHMTVNLGKGLVAGRSAEDFPLSLTFPAERYAVTIEFAGSRQTSGDTPDPAVSFSDFVFGIAASGTDAEFIGLWTAEQREGLLATAPGRIAGLRHQIAPKGEVRHLLTARLGDNWVHYYRISGSPRVHHLEFRPEDGELRLSDDLYSNIENLMVSDLTLEQVAEVTAGGEVE